MTALYEKYRSTHAVHLKGPNATSQTVHDLSSVLGDVSGCSLLELGCGGGELLSQLSMLGFSELTGIDTSPEQVSAAASFGVVVECADALTYLSRFERQYDVILAVDLLEHFDTEELVRLVTQVRARLSPGGLFVARVPNPQAPFGGVLAFGDLTHRTHLAPTAGQQLLRLAGFDQIEILACSPLFAGWRAQMRRFFWHVQQGFFRALFAIEFGRRTPAVLTTNYLLIGRSSSDRP